MRQNKMRAILLGSAAAFAVTLGGQALAADSQRQELRNELESLKARLSKLVAKREADQRRRVAAAAAVEAGAKPRSWKLPGTNTSMRIGGYVKLDLIYNVNGVDAGPFGSDQSNVNGAALDGSAAGRRQGNFRLHARQSRFFIRTWTPTDWGELATHIEGDFFGGGGNQLVSNSNSFRLRHAYGRLGPVLAGQTWSLLFQGYGYGETLDFGAPGGKGFGRVGQIRYSHSFGSGWLLAVALENPETAGSAGPGADVISTSGVALTGSTTGSNDLVPRFAFQLSHRHAKGKYGIAGSVMYHNYDNGAGLQENTLGWVIQIAGGYIFNRQLRFGGNVFFGQAHPLLITSWDTAVVVSGTTTAPTLNKVFAVGGVVWLQYRWTPQLRTNVLYSRTYMNTVNAAPGGKAALGAANAGRNQDLWQAYVNLIYSPVRNVDLGIEYSYGFRGAINGPNGKIHRIQASMKVNF